MKLFVWHTIDHKPFGIHAIKDLINVTEALCSSDFTYVERYDKKDYLDTTRPFCKKCESILKDEHNINMKQLAIEQKLGVR